MNNVDKLEAIASVVAAMAGDTTKLVEAVTNIFKDMAAEDRLAVCEAAFAERGMSEKEIEECVGTAVALSLDAALAEVVMTNTKNLGDLIDEVHDFYGCDGNFFKLGDLVFEVVEDEDDGYRSALSEVRQVVPDSKLIFFPNPVARVKVVDVDEGDFDGYSLVDADTKHAWLWAGTDNNCQYYPCFVFSYDPDPSKTVEN